MKDPFANWGKVPKKGKFKSGLKVGSDEDGFAVEHQIDADTGLRVSYSQYLNKIFITEFRYQSVGNMWDPVGWKQTSHEDFSLKYLDQLMDMMQKVAKTRALR